MARPPGEETARADDTATETAAPSHTVIRWCYPTRDVTRLTRGTALLGRAEDCTTVLTGDQLSRRHADVRRVGPLWVVRDLESKNGVFVNGERASEAPLSAGDVLRLGDGIGVVGTSGDDDEAAFDHIGPGLAGGAVLRAALAPARIAAKSDLPIIVEAETGCGKEVVARALHEWSERRDFVAVNCAALPEAMAEGELFGYRRGAFTGADRANVGYFRTADRGTLLLDEIADLPLAIQAKLLRVIETREVTSLGEAKPTPVDVRLIAAAQTPLDELVEEKKFRDDLYARLDGLTLRIPPLRERREDVFPLFTMLMSDDEASPPDVDPRFVEQLCLYDWPFNVRELVQLTRRLRVLKQDDAPLKRKDLPARIAGATRAASTGNEGTVGAPAGRRDSAGASKERDLADLVEALREHGGNVARAAEAVGISRQRAYRLMDARPDLDLEAFRSKS